MCGSGSRGNGQCPISTDCCSQYGYCGTDPEHCATLPPVAEAEAAAISGIVEQTGGTCGGGNVGNGLCPISTDCCSEYGFCGTSIEHCTASTTTQQQDTTGLAIVYPSPGTTPIPASTIGQNVYPSPVSTPTMQQPQQQQGGTIPVSQSTMMNTPTPSISTMAGVETPQFNSNGILIPAVPTSQQAITSPQQVYGTCGNGNTGNGICVLNSDCCSVQGFCGTTLEHCTNKVGPSMPGQPLYSNNDAAATTTTGTDPTYVAQVVSNTSQEQQKLPVNMDRDPTIGTTTSSGTTETSAGVLEELLQHETTTTTTTTSNSGGIVVSSTPHGTNKRIIGYFAGWQWYDRDKLANPDNMDFTKVQRVNYAFFQPDALGNIYGTDRWGDPQLLFGPYVPFMEGGAFTGVQRCSYDGPAEVNCAYHERERGLIHLAHSQGAEVYPSIGGWTLSQHFPALSADPVARDTFAKKCIDILAYHNFDGIDIDWEVRSFPRRVLVIWKCYAINSTAITHVLFFYLQYPGYVDHSGTPADTENFTKLLTAIRAGLEGHTRETGKVYGLTAALPCNPDNIKNIQVDKLIHVLSEFNLMTYDFFGAWDEKTGTNAPLYHQGFGNEAFNVDACVEKYVALGVPRAKINIGLPFYGRSYKFASELNQVHGGSDTANWGEGMYIYPSTFLIPKFNLIKRVSDLLNV